MGKIREVKDFFVDPSFSETLTFSLILSYKEPKCLRFS